MNKVVVIGRNYTSRLGMIRALGKCGYNIYVINTTKKSVKEVDAYSKYVSTYLFAPEPDRNILVGTIMSLVDKTEKLVLIPVDDYAASVVDENIDLLKDSFVFPNVQMRSGEINRLMDKNLQKRLAREAGLNVAEGWVVEIKDHRYELPKDIKYPCFPKPQISFKGNKQCMVKCADETELRKVLDAVAKQFDCPIVVEQFVEIEKEYGVLGVAVNGDASTPGLVEKIMIGDGAHKGVTKVGVVTALEKDKELAQNIHKLILSTQLTGLFDIDLYENNGRVYFNELNLRFGAFGYSIFCAGANLPEFFVRSVLLQNVNSSLDVAREKTVCISEKVNADDFLAGFYDYKEYKRLNESADFSFLKDGDDFYPYSVFKWNLVKRRVKKFLKRKLCR